MFRLLQLVTFPEDHLGILIRATINKGDTTDSEFPEPVSHAATRSAVPAMESILRSPALTLANCASSSM